MDRSGCGVFAVGAGVTGTLAYVSTKELATLRESPRSTQDERTKVEKRTRGLALAADALAGAALLAGASALYLTFQSDDGNPETEAGTRVGLGGNQVTFSYRY
jgi:hypothetical protein